MRPLCIDQPASSPQKPLQSLQCEQKHALRYVDGVLSRRSLYLLVLSGCEMAVEPDEEVLEQEWTLSKLKDDQKPAHSQPIEPVAVLQRSAKADHTADTAYLACCW